MLARNFLRVPYPYPMVLVLIISRARCKISVSDLDSVGLSGKVKVEGTEQ